MGVTNNQKIGDERGVDLNNALFDPLRRTLIRNQRIKRLRATDRFHLRRSRSVRLNLLLSWTSEPVIDQVDMTIYQITSFWTHPSGEGAASFGFLHVQTRFA